MHIHTVCCKFFASTQSHIYTVDVCARVCSFGVYKVEGHVPLTYCIRTSRIRVCPVTSTPPCPGCTYVPNFAVAAVLLLCHLELILFCCCYCCDCVTSVLLFLS